MIIRRAACLAATFLLTFLAPAGAAEVTLTARQSDFAIHGTLLDYDGSFYRIESEFGEVTLDGSGVVCAGRGCPEPDTHVETATFSGAEEVGRRLVPPLVETFARRNGYSLEREEIDERSFRYVLQEPGAERPIGAFTFRLGSSAEAFADIIADEADIAMSLREVSAAETRLAREAGRGQLTAPGRSRIVALDALVPVVAVANLLDTVGLADLRRLAEGDIDNWSALGSSAVSGPVTLHVLARGAGLGENFRTPVLGTDRASASTLVVHPSAEALAAAVADDPRVIGLTAFSAIGNTQIVPLRGPCGAVAEATVANIKSEDYPLTTPVFFYAPARRLPGIARAFIAHATSPAAQSIVRRAGFIDQFPERIPLSQQGDRLVTAILGTGDHTSLADLRDMARGLSGKARLSVSFRFEDGSAELDAQSRSNVALLAEAIDRGVFDGRSLFFVGFSDGQGAAATNRRLSRRRAEAVRDAIARRLGGSSPEGVAFEIDAFGEALPMACDEVAWGRRVNRRVEVWLD